MLQTKRNNTDGGGGDNDVNGVLKYQEMRDPIKLSQFLMQSLVFLASIAGLYVVLTNTQAKHEVRIEQLEKADADKALLIREIIQSNKQDYKEIKTDLTEIKVIIQNKQDKK